MKPIIEIKDGLWGNLATIAFLLAISALAIWLGHRSNNGAAPFACWFFSAGMVLCCYLPIDAIRKPRTRSLSIEGDDLVWRVRSAEGEKPTEDRIPLQELRALEFVIPRRYGDRSSRLQSDAELYLIPAKGEKRELPLDFFPGVHRDKIVAAIKERVPDIQVVESVGGAG